MKRLISILLTTFIALSMTAETYTIVFNSGNADSSSPTSDLNAIVLTATNNCVDRIIKSSNIYRAKEGYGIKGGKSNGKGELTLGLDDTYHITTMTVYTAAFVPANGADTADLRRLKVYDQEIAWETGHRAEIRPYQLSVNADVDSIMLSSKVAGTNRWYVQKIEFEATDPHPTRAILEMQYPKMDFGGVSWASKDEPMEDILSFEIVGKHIAGSIALSLQGSTTVFSLSETSLPAEGGEVDIVYSITLDTVISAIPFNSVVVATAIGLDGVQRSRELPIQLTVVPPSSGGSGTFDLDTARMAVGPMPGLYYELAQGQAGPLLKENLGYIICCGKRYRYGSGARKTWDAFFHTDRDTVTNQVLDMYSNNIRYFDPEHPTASVAEFDIEHMLPKSWWGGDVNPAYCDLFHLVPGDYSANRSKSNHAPGIPADSTFNNGSFVTGSGAAYGLTRVFCPADEYKGDFARAYFYIATCYGDSLQWLQTGEPGVAMDESSWEEFRPWLRDLLLDWHRMDPVSQKEKTRAIEVNKIQGNRNPFIDYPELAEYIWGNKRNQHVDFTQMEQSFGDQYGDDATALPTPVFTPAARKVLRDGQIYIVVGNREFSVLGL